MSYEELKKYLIDNKVPSLLYSLNGGMDEGKLCIDNVHGRWMIYWVERFTQYGIKFFENESEACQYFYDEISKIMEMNKSWIHKLNDL